MNMRDGPTLMVLRTQRSNELAVQARKAALCPEQKRQNVRFVGRSLNCSRLSDLPVPTEQKRPPLAVCT